MTHVIAKRGFTALCSQTSCYRYWGADYDRALCRRTEMIMANDF